MSTSVARRLQRRTLLILLALPLILLSVGFTYHSLSEFQRQDSEAKAIRSFLYPWTSLSLDIRRAESSERAYLFTGRLEYLRSLNTLTPKVEADLRDIGQLRSSDSTTQQQLGKVRSLARQKMDELHRSLDLYKNGHVADSRARLNSDTGDMFMTEIADLMSQVREHERALLSIYSNDAARDARNTFLVSTAGDLILLCFLIVAGSVIDRDDRNRALDREKISGLNQRLSTELKSRTDVLQSIQDGFCAFSSDCLLTYVNPAVERMLNRPASEWIGKSCQEILDTAHSPFIQAQIARVVRDRVTLSADHFMEQYGRWLRLRFYPSTEGGFTLYFNDITEEKEAEAERARLLSEINEARALLDTFFENAPVGLGFWDKNGRFLRANQSLAKMDGLPAAEHPGRLVSEVLPRLETGLDEFSGRVIRGESITDLELSGIAPGPSNKITTWVISCYPIRIKDEIVGIGAVIEEVTERKAIEESLRQSAKLESLGVLAGGIAHDFNNLLTGILGNASLALDSLAPADPARIILDDVISASERAAHLTHQMLSYAGKSRFLLQPVDVSELVREISSLVRVSIPRHVQLRLDLPSKLACVLGDTSQIQQVIMNLVINGAEAIPEGTPGTVYVTTGINDIDDNFIRQAFLADEISPGRYVYLEVHDTGTGMDQATIARIFDPFFTTKFTGRGLGLAAVMGIVRGHKGALKVYSTPGIGTTFKVHFPVTDQVKHAVPAPSALDGRKAVETVLVVDDEPVVRQTTKATLEKYGYTVLLADNGREGVEMVRTMSATISLVLLDLTMPLMSGEETLREIRKIAPDLKVVLSSGFNEMEAVQRFNEANLFGFLQKPYTSRKLAEVVASATLA